MRSVVGIALLVTISVGATCLEPPTPRSRNVVGNSGFEQQTLGWYLWTEDEKARDGYFRVDTAVKHQGEASLRVESPKGVAANLLAKHDLPVPGGQTLTLSAFVKVQDAQGVAIGLWAKRADGTEIRGALGVKEASSESSQFQRVVTTVTLPDDCGYVRPILMSGGGGTVWWDAVQLELGDSASEYVPGWGLVEMRQENRVVALKYAKAIIAESDLRDQADQVERLVVYLKEAGLDAASFPVQIQKLRGSVAEIERSLQTETVTPSFTEFDYETIERQIADGLSAAATLRQSMVSLLASPAPWFAPEPVPMPAPLETNKRVLLDRFLIFPLTVDAIKLYEGDGDWELLKAFGFEAICPWAGTWLYGRDEKGKSVDEVVAGAIEKLDSVIAENAKHGMKTSIWIEPDNVVWALEPEFGEDIYLHDADGNYYRRARIHSGVNIWHPEVIKQLCRFMTTVGEHYRDNPNVLCYEVFEEPSLTLAKPNPEPGSKIVHPPAGYSRPAKEAFRAYLENIYSTIYKLNARWGATYKSFADVEPPEKLRGEHTPVPVLYDFCWFRTTSHAAYFQQLADALRQADPNHAVMPQYVPMFYGWRDAGYDAFLMADAGWDVYATHDWPGQGPAWETAYTYSAAHWAGKPIWNEEYIWSNWVRREQGEVALWAGSRSGVWRQFAWGKRGLELFEWDGDWNTEFEGDWNNAMLNKEMGMALPRYAAGVFPYMGRKLDALAHILYPTEIVHDGLAQLVPTTSILASDDAHSQVWWAQVASKALLDRHWAPLFVPEDFILNGRADLAQSKVIVVPSAPVVPKDLLVRLMAWVKQGGTLIWLKDFATLDEQGQPLDLVQGIIKDGRRPFVNSLESVRVAEHGQGRLIECGSDAISREPDILDELVSEAYSSRAVYSSARDVELILRRNPATGDLVLVATSLDVARTIKAEVSVRGQWSRAVDYGINGGAPVPLEVRGDCTHVTLRLAPGEGTMIRFSN